VLRTPKLKNLLQDNFSRAATHNKGLKSSEIGDKVCWRWFVMIAIETSMKMASEQVL
jgi:hypothetical protein